MKIQLPFAMEGKQLFFEKHITFGTLLFFTNII